MPARGQALSALVPTSLASTVLCRAILQYGPPSLGAARRPAGTQTQADIVTELKSYAYQLERQAFLFDQQATEFARKLAVTHQPSGEIKDLANKA